LTSGKRGEEGKGWTPQTGRAAAGAEVAQNLLENGEGQKTKNTPKKRETKKKKNPKKKKKKKETKKNKNPHHILRSHTKHQRPVGGQKKRIGQP